MQHDLMRLYIALGIFLLMISWEAVSPRRKTVTRKRRWSVNFGLALCNIVMMRLTVGGLAYFSAVHALENSWGLLNQFIVPEWLSILLTLLVLDFAIYVQHIISHKWSLLWRLHQVHHTDLGFDATTAIRFHPLEILLSMFYKVAWIYLLGANPAAVVIFEIILNGAATFNHSNINLPLKLDTALRWLIITPDMHRIHHSIVRHEMDSNYGFSISLWDRLFRTYTAEPEQLQTTMPIGLPIFREERQVGFIAILLLPFKRLLRA